MDYLFGGGESIRRVLIQGERWILVIKLTSRSFLHISEVSVTIIPVTLLLRQVFIRTKIPVYKS